MHRLRPGILLLASRILSPHPHSFPALHYVTGWYLPLPSPSPVSPHLEEAERSLDASSSGPRPFFSRLPGTLSSPPLAPVPHSLFLSPPSSSSWAFPPFHPAAGWCPRLHVSAPAPPQLSAFPRYPLLSHPHHKWAMLHRPPLEERAVQVLAGHSPKYGMLGLPSRSPPNASPSSSSPSPLRPPSPAANPLPGCQSCRR